MEKNVGSSDKLIRYGIALVALVAGYFLGFGSVGGVIALVVAVLMVLTATINFCPIYRIFGLNTNRSKTH